MKKLFLLCLLMAFFASVAVAQKSAADAAAEKAEMLQKELRLTKYQTEKIKAIYQDAYEKFDKVLASANGNKQKIITCLRPLRAATINKLKTVLDSRQFAAYASVACDGVYNRETVSSI